MTTPTSTLNVKEFLDTDFREFADYDNQRKLPHLADGLKISSRKVLYTMIQHPKLHKVSNLGNMASALTHYEHGETSIIDTVNTLAQDYPGANNCPLFKGQGQFGTRLNHEASSPRYIFVEFHDNYRKLFCKDDEAVCVEQTKEEDVIEPLFMLPLLPLILINGGSGIGNGFSSNILPHDPKDVKNAVLSVLAGKVPAPLTPRILNWSGDVERENDRRFAFKGKLTVVNTTTLCISELPPDADMFVFKDRLNKLLSEKHINSYDNDSTAKGWMFTIKVPRATAALSMKRLEEMFAITSKVTQNFTLWNFEGKLQRFENAVELLTAWVAGRLPFFEKRRVHLLAQYESEAVWLFCKARFIELWHEQHTKRSGAMSLQEIKGMAAGISGATDEIVASLLRIPVSSLSLDDIKALDEKRAGLQHTIDFYKTADAKALMVDDVKNIKL